MAFDRGLHDEAAAHLDRCARLRPRDATTHLALGQVLLTAGRFEEARAAFERALRLRPADTAATAGIAGVLERQRHREEALEILEPLVRVGREDARTAALYARLAVQSGRAPRAIEIASRHASDDAPPQELRLLFFALGDALENAGDCDEAFAAYSRANELLRAPFDAAAAAERFERLMRACSRDALSRLPRARDACELAVFIVGMPRSATTLVDRIIDAHPEAHGGGELDLMPRIADTLAQRIGSILPWPQCIRDLDQHDVDCLGAEYLEGVRALAPQARRVTDKQLGNDQALGLISLLLPGSRVIHCTRDPLDTCFSCFAHPLEPLLHPYASDLRSLGVMYRLVERLMAHWKEALDLPFLTVGYEELVENQDPQSRRIVEFCGLPWDERCLRFYETAGPAHTLSYDQVRRPIYRTSAGRAARFQRHLGPLREALEAPLPFL